MLQYAKHINPTTNDYFRSENKHYITIFMITDYESGVAQVLEPEKCECWQWFDLDNLPENLFLSAQNLLKQYNFYNLQNFTQNLKELN